MKKACPWFPCSVVVLCAYLVTCAGVARAQSLTITSAPNAVGSGARALGMGGAFIAVADDATAASWNPGGLTQLERPEISFVYDFARFSESVRSGSHPELNTDESLSLDGVNYLSVAYPFPWTLGGRNFVLSLNYQRKYDFDRAFDLRYSDLAALTGGNIAAIRARIRYRQEGQLSALSPAFGIELTETLSVGAVLNLWDQSIIPSNEWTIRTEERRFAWVNNRFLPGSRTVLRVTEKYRDFSGTNLTLGAFYRPDDRWSFGLVYHTPFTAEVDYSREVGVFNAGAGAGSTLESRRKKIDFPWAIGVGAAWRHPNDRLIFSADITYRAWDRFIVRDPRNPLLARRKVSGVTGLDPDEAEVDGTWTARAGMEYLFINDRKPKQNLLPSIRAGLFYDPEPASHRKDRWYGLDSGTGQPDHYFGLTLGAGVLIGDRVNLDFAYIYRWGRDARRDTFALPDTDIDVDRHQFYASTVIYF
ncbi:MAG TPA: outer membrane protein transport protein [Candidatus Hydrogenedentes bacterium]|nr:outer membrane protein transport protein [Candidatus Hydrogenedentota bacterium]